MVWWCIGCLILGGCIGLMIGGCLAAAREEPKPGSDVVHCKECKHLYDYMDDYFCASHRGLVRICENSFCSYGERRPAKNV